MKILCFRDTTFAPNSEVNSCEEVEASRCSGTLSSTRFSLNAYSHSGRSRDESPRTSSLILSLLIHAMLCRSTASCDENVRDVSEDELEELVDGPGTTNGT